MLEGDSSDTVFPENRELRRITTKIDFSTSDKATKRVIAPFVKIFRKRPKGAPTEQEEEPLKYVFPYKRPSVLVHHMSGFLSENLDLSSLLHDTVNVLKTAVKAKGVLLYLIDGDDIYLSHRHYQNERLIQKWKIGPGSITAAHAAHTKRVIVVEDILTDMRFDNTSQSRDETMKSVVCVPIITPDDECFSILEFFRDVEQPTFNSDDINTILVVTSWVSVAVQQNQTRLLLQKKLELHQYFLQLFTWVSDSALPEINVVQEVLDFIKHTLGAEKGLMYQFKKVGTETFYYVYEETAEKKLAKKLVTTKYFEDAQIINSILQNPRIINITDPNDPFLLKFSDNQIGSIYRATLLLPIVILSEVVAIFIMINKLGCEHFTKADVKLAELLETYTAITLKHSEIIMACTNADYEREELTDLINCHSKACEHDRKYYLEKVEGVILPNNFIEFSWYIDSNDLDNMPRYILYMIKTVCGHHVVNNEQMMDFILSMRKNYRKNPYHNFEHAFNVCHCVYNIVRRNMSEFDDVERKGLIIAALCHDVDHIGFTNSYLINTDHLWAKLYSTSPLESHHAEVTLRMMKNFNIFNNMDEDSYGKFESDVEEYIVNTDLFLFFDRKLKFTHLYQNGLFDINDKVHRSYMKSILMFSADLSSNCKSFHVSKRLTDLLMVEYYRQGDLERQMGFTPLPLFDRYQSHRISIEQVKFLNAIVLPCFELLKNVFPNTSPIYENCKSLFDQWREIGEFKNQKTWKQDDSIFCQEERIIEDDENKNVSD